MTLKKFKQTRKVIAPGKSLEWNHLGTRGIGKMTVSLWREDTSAYAPDSLRCDLIDFYGLKYVGIVKLSGNAKKDFKAAYSIARKNERNFCIPDKMY